MWTQEQDLVDTIGVKWANLMALARQTMDHLRDISPQFKASLITNVQSFVAAAGTFKADYDQNGPMVCGIPPRDAVERLKKFQVSQGRSVLGLAWATGLCDSTARVDHPPLHFGEGGSRRACHQGSLSVPVGFAVQLRGLREAGLSASGEAAPFCPPGETAVEHGGEVRAHKSCEVDAIRAEAVHLIRGTAVLLSLTEARSPTVCEQRMYTISSPQPDKCPHLSNWAHLLSLDGTPPPPAWPLAVECITLVCIFCLGLNPFTAYPH